MGSFFDLLMVASMPILKVLLITALGLFLALNRINILGEITTNHLNKLVYSVFGPALVASNLAKTVTFKSFLTLWFMVPNVVLSLVIGSAMGWTLAKITKAPKHVKGLILASCSVGNLGNIPLIVLPAMCKEKGSPFGTPDVCERYGLAYASLSMAIGSVLFWLYAYNIVRITSKDVLQNLEANPTISSANPSPEAPRISISGQINVSWRIKQRLRKIAREFNLKAVLAPSTMGAIVGFFIGMISPLQKLLMDDNSPLHVVGDTSFMIGNASIPSSTLILGANLLRGTSYSYYSLHH
ncbi:protein PIN-LIKES 3-like [Amaranthus tricolor]|uniref:protein PIN-LIKES 3-like n=1 Tax=Amaranthus tricolor TaxID=29722 RepID=UPI002590B454|nr:protein PIN-LIKES 3-like [Amaranthus tricolor]